MKLCFVAHLNDLSGANRSLVDLVSCLKEKHDITVIVPRRGELYEYLKHSGINCKIIHSGMWMFSKSEKKIKIFLKWIINYLAEIRFFFYYMFHHYDLVHFNSSTYGCGAKSLNRLKRKYTWHIRELAEETFFLSFYNRQSSIKLINEAEKIIAISEFIANNMKKDINTTKVEIVYNGIKIPPKKKIDKIAIEKFLFVGAINRDKCQIDALKAINSLKKDYGITLPVIFLGKVTNEIYYRELIQYINDNDLNELVRFIGYKQDISDFRTSNNLVLMCSPKEAFGRVTIEALANQQLIVANNGGATSEILVDGQYGFVYNDANELVVAIHRALEFDDKMKMINESYEYVKNNFSIQKTANRVDSILSNIVINKERKNS